MLARLDPRLLERIWFPLGEQTKDETRAEAARAGLEAAQRAESQEACFLAGDDYRDFLERARARSRRPGAIVDEDGRRARPPRRLLALHARAAQGLGVAAGEPLYALGTDPRTNTRRRRPARRARRAARHGARPALRRRRPRRGEAPLPLARGAARSTAHASAASGSSSTSRRTASRRARRPSSTKATPSSVPARSYRTCRNLRRLRAYESRGADDRRPDPPDHSARRSRYTRSRTSCSAAWRCG